jgi:SIR2-like domain/TIR domain
MAAGTETDGAGGRAPLRIFINYRHEDVPFAASTLYRELKGRFDAENIFFDSGTLRPGMQFIEAITSHLTGTGGAFLALIGPQWLPTMDAHRRRGDDDYVVQEIDLGLRNGWTVIPVLLNDATLPHGRDLPLAIRALPRYQVAHLRQTSLDADVEDLIARLDEIGSRPPVDEQVRDPEPEVRVGPGEGRAISEVPPADDEHYQMLADEADNLVIFLGAGANADDRDGPFRPGASMLPDDADIAEYLAVKARLKSSERQLAEVAQYARMIRGEPRVFSWVKSIFANSAPGPVHRYLARLPRRLEELGLEKRYQMIVTSKFDVALEQAFLEAKEPFDVAIYMAPGTEHAGRFVHVEWGAVDSQPIMAPNEYDGFPIVGDDSQLTRTVIVRINGAIDDPEIGYRWKNNYVITEDHYIDYFGGRPAEEVVPMQILAKLRQSSCLFLGYALADWRLRVFLHWIWPGERPSGATHWAVQRRPDVLERRFWEHAGVGLYRSRLTDYMQGFDRFLVTNRDDLR